MDESQMQNRAMLAGKLVSELQAIAEQVGVKDPKKRKKAELIDAILSTVNVSAPSAPATSPVASNGARPEEGPHPQPVANGSPESAAPPAPSGIAPWEERGHDTVQSERPAETPEPFESPATTVATEAVEPPESGSVTAGEAAPAPVQTEGAHTGTHEAAGAGESPAAAAPTPTSTPEAEARAPEAQAETGGALTLGTGTEFVAPAPASTATNGDMPAPAPSSAPVGEASQDGQAQVTAPPSGSPSGAPAQSPPEYRRDGEGVRERDRGRRRRRRERGGGDRPERPGERTDRQPERTERQPMDRPRLDQRREEMIDRGPRRDGDFDDSGDLEVRTGVLDVLPEGYGFLRTSGYLPGQEDVYVSLSQVRRAQLRRGDHIVGAVRRPKEGEKYQALVRIDKVDDMVPEEIVGRKWFEKLTPLYPEERLHMELAENPGQITQRIIDLVAPIGKGQRGMIVSPPKAGKTTIMKQIANSITSNNPECHLIVLLVDERPEEVTDMQRSVEGEIVYSTFDRPSEDHIQVTELTLDRAKRLVELGKDVVILLDGITRLSRAYNLATPASGRILSGGVDSTALYPPKRFFGAARNIEQGGSLTIIATALVETGSRMDEVIFEEFKGTGNWELRLDRRASEKRLFPAIDIQASGTRKEELLLSSEELALVWKLRRVLHALDSVAALELLIDKMRQTKGNMQFLREIQKVQIGD